uniref:CCHC-type domain-containing protein n=1 Tax=Pygocentrus nattereri TaxID=42514 RepID=A0A3B4C8D8_PYGNA
LSGREDGKGGLTHPPAYFSLNGNKGYLFYRGQPAFCRGCLQHGHEVSGCRDLNCKNCLGQGHLAKDCKNPRRCKSCGGEGHLAHSCPRREATYATVLAGAGVGEQLCFETWRPLQPPSAACRRFTCGTSGTRPSSLRSGGEVRRTGA